MPDIAEPAICRFDDFLFYKQAGTLVRLHPDGHRSPVQLGSRACQILCLLVDRQGELVSRREIMDAVWPNVAVEQNNLTVQLAALRRVLDADRGQGSCIENITGRGYRFVPAVTLASTPSPDQVAEDDGVSDRGEIGDAFSTRPGPADFTSAAQSIFAAIARRLPIKPPRSYMALVVASFLCVVALPLFGLWHVNRAPSSQSSFAAAPAIAVPTATTSVERPRLSLVVLPFHNLGGEGMDDATVDAITEDVASDLGRAYNLFVIGRTSAFTYKDKPVDIKRVGEELGVRYVVEGSVRKADGTLRVNVQLVSAESGAQVWGDHFGIDHDGMRYSVDEVVRQIAFVLSARVIDSESIRSARERPTNPDVTDLLVRARSLNSLPPTPQRLTERVMFSERAVELDPSSATALAGLAEALLDSIDVFAEDPTVPVKLQRADELVRRAELLRPYDNLVMFARVYLLGMQRRCSDLIPAAKRAIWAYPNINSTHHWLGICLMFEGRAAEAIPEYEQSIRLNPRNPWGHIRYRLIGYSLLFLGRYDEAISWFERSLAAHPNDTAASLGNVRAAVAAAQALAGRIDEARLSAAEATRLWPTLTARSYYPLKITNPLNAAQVSRMRDGLRLAGFRDHVDEDVDPGLPPDDVLHSNYETPTPISAPGAQTIRTPDLAALMEQRRPLVLDTIPWGRSIPGAVGLWGAGIGGNVSDEYQDRLRRKMQQLIHGDQPVPVVAMSRNAEAFQGRNLALRLVALGYTEVYWYRGGREAWEVAGHPMAELAMQDW